MSEPPRGGDEQSAQEFGWGRFSHHLSDFLAAGLGARTFFWSSGLSRRDVLGLFETIESMPVVVLGNGVTPLGMRRYQALGHAFFGDAGLFGKLLHRRCQQGLLTAGTSAGAKQLGSLFNLRGTRRGPFWSGFGLAGGIAVEVHHEWSLQPWLQAVAARRRRCMWFGLPNDSAIELAAGRLRGGWQFQLLRFVIDTTWDAAPDQWHIKTRQGMKIDHYYPDGRHWGFNDGDLLLRVRRTGRRLFRHAWMQAGGRVLEYTTQQPVPFAEMRALMAWIEGSR